MQKINTGDGLFVDGNPSTGALGTVLTATWLNMVQAEIISVLTAAGITVDGAKSDQLTTAIQTLLRGKATVNVAGGASVTLNAAQYGMPILILTGALTANINLIFPAISGAWIVRNQTTGAFTVTCKTAAGTGVVVSQGYNNALWGDGTNIYAEQSDWLNIALTGTPTAPTAAAGTNTTQLANMAAVQQAVNGKLTKSVAGGATVTLTTTEAGYAMLELTGALTANIAVVVPTASGQWIVKNATTGAYTLTVKTAAGTGEAVPQGVTQSLWCDGTNVLESDGGKADKATTLAGYGITDAKQIQPIAASVASNALTLTLNPTSLDFRSNALNSGTVNSRSVAAAISLAVPSGATLGTVNATTARLALLAIDNAGTVELAVANLAGGVNLDETTLISTTAISAAATSSSTIYSTTARTNVPFRVVGYIDITEAAAGTWATAPSTIQGQGGQALAALSSLGYGQTMQDMTASRAYGTTYYNTTGRPIFVSAGGNSSGSGSLLFNINGVSSMNQGTGTSGFGVTINFIVPVGASYSVSSSSIGLVKWLELR